MGGTSRSDSDLILVTGAAGRVGANVVRRLAAADRPVRAFVLEGDSQARKLVDLPGVELYAGDLRNQASVDEACAGVGTVVHLAAQLLRGATPVEDFYDTNAFSTLRLLDALRRSGVEVNRFVLASTDGTYCPGDPVDVPLTEDSSQFPADFYGTSKLLGEQILTNFSYQYEIPHTIVRFSTVVSPEEAARWFTVGNLRQLFSHQAKGRDSHLWPLFAGHPGMLERFEGATDGLADETPIGAVDQDGAAWTISFLDVRDAADGVLTALGSPAAVGESFNLSSGPPVDYTQGAATIARLTNQEALPPVVMPTRWRLELDASKAARVLGWHGRYDFPASARDGVANPDGGDAFVPARLATSG